MTIKNPGRRATTFAAAAVVSALTLAVAEVPSATADAATRVALPSPNAASLLDQGATTAPTPDWAGRSAGPATSPTAPTACCPRAAAPAPPPR